MRLVQTLVVLALLSAGTLAQTPPAPKPSASGKCQQTPSGDATAARSTSCTPAPATPQSAGERFPYPGEAPAPSTGQAPASTPGTAAPATPQPQPTGTAGQFPYPGDSSSSSSSSSSSASGDSSSSSSAAGGSDTPGTDETATRPSPRRKLPKVERLQSDEDRAAEDLTVAKFYQQSGNLQAAYLRTKDAVKLQPDDPETHFALAEVAKRLNRKEEASAEYTAYLKLEPDGDRASAAQKALSGLR